MSERSTQVKLEAATVTDRGLNERRPLNEDSYLANTDFCLFAVADGVGGAEAGEVASQTAIEVLETAFRHQKDDDDVEDLLEIAVQRANDSIYRMSREHPKFAMMATTIVALHVEGLHATVGHVGDSRLYLVTPDGAISRETEDHSVVEEEVRAGRMTPEQAQNHPSRNVISRALGAEPDVEVDLNTFDVENGTTFLICTDGITRHIPDEELASIVRGASDLQSACDEMKRRCFERGAEDNLTAVLVRVGEAPARAGVDDGFDEEKTLVSERAAVAPQAFSHAAPPRGGEFESAGGASPSAASSNQVSTTQASSVHASSNQSSSAEDATRERLPMRVEPSTPPKRVARRSRAGLFLLVLFLLAGFSAAAFYGGMLFEQRRPQAVTSANIPPAPTPAPADVPIAVAAFEAERGRIDSAPVSEASRMEAEMNAQPSNADDPKFQYLYGRALLLSGRPVEAVSHFEKSVNKIQEAPNSSNARLIIDARLATAAAHLQSNDVDRAREAANALGQVYEGPGASPAPSQQPTAPASAPSPF